MRNSQAGGDAWMNGEFVNDEWMMIEQMIMKRMTMIWTTSLLQC
jgi:hypothetical protein